MNPTAGAEMRDLLRDLLLPAFKDAPVLTGALLVGVTILVVIQVVIYLAG